MRTRRSRITRTLLATLAVTVTHTGITGLAAGRDIRGAATADVTAERVQPPRDPWLRPFSSTSIWNMPIGSGATYAPAGLPRDEARPREEITIMRTKPSDPARRVIRIGGWRKRCSGTEFGGQTIHLPDGWQPKPVTAKSTPNNGGVFLQPDGRTLVYLNAMARCSPTGPLYAQWSGNDASRFGDLYGDGRRGYHGASSLNQMGGAIRPGDLTGGPIGHALDILISAEHLWWGGNKASSYRWPAVTSDDYAGPDRYLGDNPQLKMGSLLALRPSLTPGGLGVKTDVGRRIFEALQDYGGYVTDDAGWDATYIGVDAAAMDSFRWGDAEVADMNAIFANLSVVTNNGPDRIGGGGQPRVPLLPELVPPR